MIVIDVDVINITDIKNNNEPLEVIRELIIAPIKYPIKLRLPIIPLILLRWSSLPLLISAIRPLNGTAAVPADNDSIQNERVYVEIVVDIDNAITRNNNLIYKCILGLRDRQDNATPTTMNGFRFPYF